jgi:predicted TIM-barrel enzyme
VPDFRRLSSKARLLLPVIHATDRDQALRNATVALANGADGVFLISHTARLDFTRLAGICDLIKYELDNPWVGMNFLDLHKPTQALDYVVTTPADGLWVDNARLMEGKYEQRVPLEVSKKLTLLGDRGPMYFGGVAMKGQPLAGDPGRLAALAVNFMDVVTTSGPATGVPVDVDKVRRMKSAMLRDRPLAVASGVSATNVHEILPYVTFFLVATSLRKSDDEPDALDPEKVRELAGIIHAWSDHQ